MVKYSSSIILPYARERVWKVMSDWTNLAAWDVNITKSELAASQKPGQSGLGTKYYCEFTANGMSGVKIEYECIEYEEPSHCKYLGLATLFRSQDCIDLEAVSDESTKLTGEFNLTFRGPLYPFSFTMDGAMQKTGPVVMKNIEKFVSEQLGSGSPAQ